MEAPKGRIVSLGTDDKPRPKPESKDERLEEMLKIANALGRPDNDQSGKGKKNPDKGVRAARRAKKLARKKNRYR